VVVKRLFGSHGQKALDGMTSQIKAWLLGAGQDGGDDVGFCASLKTNFIRKTCTLEAETSVPGFY